MSVKRWAIVECMGHRVYAGEVEEIGTGEHKIFQVEVPAVQLSDWGPVEIPGSPHTVEVQGTAYYERWTRIVGVGSLYGLSYCKEATARKKLAEGGTQRNPDGPERFEPDSVKLQEAIERYTQRKQLVDRQATEDAQELPDPVEERFDYSDRDDDEDSEGEDTW